MGREATGVVVALILVAAMVGVGAIVFGEFFATLVSMKPGMTTAANATIDAIGTNTWSGFNLTTLLPLVLAAGAIIAAVTYYLAGEG